MNEADMNQVWAEREQEYTDWQARTAPLERERERLAFEKADFLDRLFVLLDEGRKLMAESLALSAALAEANKQGGR